MNANLPLRALLDHCYPKHGWRVRGRQASGCRTGTPRDQPEAQVSTHGSVPVQSVQNSGCYEYHNGRAHTKLWQTTQKLTSIGSLQPACCKLPDWGRVLHTV